MDGRRGDGRGAPGGGARPSTCVRAPPTTDAEPGASIAHFPLAGRRGDGNRTERGIRLPGRAGGHTAPPDWLPSRCASDCVTRRRRAPPLRDALAVIELRQFMGG